MQTGLIFNLEEFAPGQQGGGGSGLGGRRRRCSGELGMAVRWGTDRGGRDEHDGGSPRAKDDGSGRNPGQRPRREL
jgi:hypothetical protein